MSKTVTIRAQVEPQLKEEVQSVLKKLGLSMSEAINFFLWEMKDRKALPFDANIPNRATRHTLKRSAAGKDLMEFDSKEELFKHLGI
ncbi:MAG TPA: type II toxin-antitoxin system RelB/DinJ family antitoxin [Candidatus Kapabacteria bacterium]|nr:type II toxin-antitoxin system RelB/DinJ family antitoxin [Candidatus Kapabacteria bacterium]